MQGRLQGREKRDKLRLRPRQTASSSSSMTRQPVVQVPVPPAEEAHTLSSYGAAPKQAIKHHTAHAHAHARHAHARHAHAHAHAWHAWYTHGQGYACAKTAVRSSHRSSSICTQGCSAPQGCSCGASVPGLLLGLTPRSRAHTTQQSAQLFEQVGHLGRAAALDEHLAQPDDARLHDSLH